MDEDVCQSYGCDEPATPGGGFCRRCERDYLADQADREYDRRQEDRHDAND